MPKKFVNVFSLVIDRNKITEKFEMYTILERVPQGTREEGVMHNYAKRYGYSNVHFVYNGANDKYSISYIFKEDMTPNIKAMVCNKMIEAISNYIKDQECAVRRAREELDYLKGNINNLDLITPSIPSVHERRQY